MKSLNFKNKKDLLEKIENTRNNFSSDWNLSVENNFYMMSKRYRICHRNEKMSIIVYEEFSLKKGSVFRCVSLGKENVFGEYSDTFNGAIDSLKNVLFNKSDHLIRLNQNIVL